MVKKCAQLHHKQDAQKESKKFTVKVKRLNVDKKFCYSKEKEHSSHKKRGCEPKQSAKSGCANAVALQDLCTSKLSEKTTKSKSHGTKSFKRAVVRLKRLKYDNTTRLLSTTDLSRESALSGCSKTLNLQSQCSTSLCKEPKESNPQLTSVKKAVVRLKRFKFISTTIPLTSAHLPRDDINYQTSGYSNLKEEPKKSKQPRVTKSIREQTITILQKDCKQLKSSKLNKNLKKVQKVTNTKMRTRFQDTICKGFDILPKSKETPSRKASLSNNVFRKQHGLVDLVMTPEDRNNLNKLSLTKRPSKRRSADANATNALEILAFSPVRNSTAYGIDEETLCKEKYNEGWLNLTRASGDRSGPNKDNSNSEENRIPKNIANKPDLIEQLLCCDEEQQTHTRKERNGKESQATKPVNSTHKFFHRLPEKQPHSNKLPAELENIFEFLSQSDTSEAEIGKCKDPAADIIKKLISDGKVRVAVNNKGTGRPILKRCQPKNRRKKQIEHKNKASKLKGAKKTAASTINDAMLQSEVHNNYDHDDDNGSQNLNDHPSYSAIKGLEADEHVSDGGFSRLARSVLLQQTKKYENTRIKTLAEKRRLLEVARKFVSTPASNRIKGNLPTADISPIQALSTQGRPVCPSPWRIDDDLHLPSIFNFTKNTSCLPSFSSDYIPPTPRKIKPNGSSQLCNGTNVPIDKSAISSQGNSANVPNNIRSSESSGCLQSSRESGNDSNAENMPPKEVTPARNLSNNDENADAFSKLPNPRRTLKYRSPLKAINVIEVINLPPWKKPMNSDDQKETNVKKVTFDNNKDDESHNADDLFGFEEFLDQSSDNGDASNAANITVAKRISIKRNLHKKLKDLKKWRPKNSVLDTSNISENPSLVFNDNGDRPKQRLIREMLCSTMINQVNKKRSGKDEKIECNREEGDVQPIEADFFNDYEPEDSFQKKPQRTYARPVKRKRKGLKNFVMFLDSEESNSDSEEEEHEHRKKAQKKKRHEAHNKPEANPELESFVSEFNSMCKEVENYELLVE